MVRRRLPAGAAPTLFVAALALLALAWLMADTAHATYPGDNGRIAFAKQSDGGLPQIWVIGPDGSDPTRLTCGGGSFPVWSPDGRRIASPPFVIDADGRNPTRLTGWGPVWSPIGERIAVTRTFASRVDFYDEVWVVNADGSGDVHMAGAVAVPRQPWSPDGARLALHNSVYDADTGESRVFADSGDPWSFDDEPAWSSRDVIAFTRATEQPSFRSDIWRVNPDGSDQAQLTDAPENDASPLWSPDGQRIAFNRARELWVMDADGTNQTPVATDVRSYDWSPDGQRIAFVRDRDGMWELWVTSPDGSDRSRLARGQPGLAYVWSPNGQRIVYVDSRSGETATDIWAVSADGSDRTLLAEGARAPDWQPLPAGSSLGPPPSQFCFGKVRHNTKRGVARLVVEVPRPGRVVLHPRRGVSRFARAHRDEGAGRVVLKVRPRGNARQRLDRKNRLRVRAQVTYRPRVGEPVTKGRRVWLVKR